MPASCGHITAICSTYTSEKSAVSPTENTASPRNCTMERMDSRREAMSPAVCSPKKLTGSLSARSMSAEVSSSEAFSIAPPSACARSAETSACATADAVSIASSGPSTPNASAPAGTTSEKTYEVAAGSTMPTTLTSSAPPTIVTQSRRVREANRKR